MWLLGASPPSIDRAYGRLPCRYIFIVQHSRSWPVFAACFLVYMVRCVYTLTISFFLGSSVWR